MKDTAPFDQHAQVGHAEIANGGDEAGRRETRPNKCRAISDGATCHPFRERQVGNLLVQRTVRLD